MTDEDRLLRMLPPHPVPPEAKARARAAFLRAREDTPWYKVAARTIVPAALATVVGLYLFWAFDVAIAINR